jgi:photosystem II stability/assembly factor-like uncharacterized protein
MRTRRMWSVLFCLVALFPWNSHAQWTRLNGPEGASPLSTFTTQNGTVFVGTLGGGVYRSEDGGRTWSFASAGLTDLDIYSLGGIGTRVYAGTRGGGLFSSTDNGGSWQSVTPAGPSTILIKAILATDNVLLISSTGRTMYRSSDTGATWAETTVAPSAASITSLRSIDGSICATDDFGDLYRSTDDGISWTEIDPGHGNRIHGITGWTSGAVVMATEGGVYISNDDFQTWSPMNQGLLSPGVRSIFADDQGALYADALPGIVRWNASTSSWEDAQGSLPADQIVAFTDLPGADFLTVSPTNIVQRWDAASSTWTPATHGLAAPRLYSIGRDLNGNLYAGGASGFVFKTTDGGSSWTQFFSGQTPQIVNGIVYLEAKTFILGTQGSGMFITRYDGDVWDNQNYGLSSLYIYGMHHVGGGEVFAATSKGLFRCPFPDLNWYEADPRYPYSCNAVSGIGGYVVAAFDSGRVLLSDGNGANWRISQLPTQNSVVFVKRLPWGALIAAVESEGLYISSYEAATWQLLTAQFASAYPGDLLAVGNKDLYYATYGMGVWRSTDRGASWTEMNDGLTIDRMTALIVRDGHLYACSQGAGVFRSNDRVVAVEHDHPAFADGITLLGCAPMPFTGEGTIRFSTTLHDEATLTVHDVTGRRVLEHRKSVQSGENFFFIETSGLPSGIYQYRIAAGHAARSGRFVVMQQ